MDLPGKRELTDFSFEEQVRLSEETSESVVAPYLCPECFDRVIREFMHEDTAGEAQKRYIEENVALDRRVAAEVPSDPYGNYMF